MENLPVMTLPPAVLVWATGMLKGRKADSVLTHVIKADMSVRILARKIIVVLIAS